MGYGKVAAASLLDKLAGGAPVPAPEPSRSTPARLRSLFRREKRSEDDTGIRVSGLPDVLVRFAGCCDPLPGDDVIGFVTRGRGVTVHVRDCPQVFEFDPDRRIDVQWDDESAAARPIKIRVTLGRPAGPARQGHRSRSPRRASTSARPPSRPDESGQAVQTFELWVTDLDSLNAVMKEIQRVKGVRSVERVRG